MFNSIINHILLIYSQLHLSVIPAKAGMTKKPFKKTYSICIDFISKPSKKQKTFLTIAIVRKVFEYV